MFSPVKYYQAIWHIYFYVLMIHKVMQYYLKVHTPDTSVNLKMNMDWKIIQ